MNILFITNLVPWPLDGGGKIKTFTTLKVLSEMGNIDLISFYENENILACKKELTKYCRSVVILPIRVTSSENKIYMAKVALKCLLLGKPFGIYKYFNKRMAQEINNFLQNNTYDTIYFDHLQVYQYKRMLQENLSNVTYILDMHNCETAIFSRRAEESTNYFKQKYLETEAVKLSEFEKWAIQDADKLILLSTEDKRELEKLAGVGLKCDIIPIGVQEPKQIKTIRKGNNNTMNVLFIGTLTWAPNNEGMIWFLENVMPEISEMETNYNFYIVGKGASDRIRDLASKYNNIIITGYVDSVDEYYEKCDFMIVPLFFGSGQRVKIIEGFSRGMPMISTSIGAEGLEYINGDNILIADDKKTFIKEMEMMKNEDLRRSISKKARLTFENNYSEIGIKRMLKKVIASNN